MQELSSFQCYFILVCSVAFIHAQDAGPLFNSHSQLLQSFHNEVKSLEAAAKRVQELMMDSSFANSAKKTETQTEVQTEVSKQATENRPFQESKPFEVTVLANPNILRNGVLGKQQSKPVAADAIKQPEHNQQIPLNPGAFFMPFGSFFNSLTGKPNIQTPWWKGKNVCMKTESADDNKKNGEGKNMDTQFVIFGTGSFERCKQTANKYICTTMVSTPESTRTSTITYECCEGYRREGNECVEGDNSEKIGFFDDSSSDNKYNFNNNNKKNIDNNDWPEGMTGNKVEKENNDNQYIPIKVTIPIENQAKTELDMQSKTKNDNQMENGDDKSYSSQSEELENGNPVWLERFYRMRKFDDWVF